MPFLKVLNRCGIHCFAAKHLPGETIVAGKSSVVRNTSQSIPQISELAVQEFNYQLRGQVVRVVHTSWSVAITNSD
jgi:hypothetical protein